MSRVIFNDCTDLFQKCDKCKYYNPVINSTNIYTEDNKLTYLDINCKYERICKIYTDDIRETIIREIMRNE